MSSPNDSPFQPGDLIKGKWKIVRPASMGGSQGSFYLVVAVNPTADQDPGKEFIAKIYHRGFAKDKLSTEAYAKLAGNWKQALARHIFPVLDAFDYAQFPGAEPVYIEIMPLSHEGDLRRYYQQIPAEELITIGNVRRTMQIILQISEALDHAHRLRPPLLHCDIKADNVFIVDALLRENRKPAGETVGEDRSKASAASGPMHFALADWGIALLNETARENTYAYRQERNTWLAPPEYHWGPAAYLKGSDFFQLGLLLLELYGLAPKSRSTAIRKSQCGDWIEEIEQLPELLQPLALHLLDGDPDSRWSFPQVAKYVRQESWPKDSPTLLQPCMRWEDSLFRRRPYAMTREIMGNPKLWTEKGGSIIDALTNWIRIAGDMTMPTARYEEALQKLEYIRSQSGSARLLAGRAAWTLDPSAPLHLADQMIHDMADLRAKFYVGSALEWPAADHLRKMAESLGVGLVEEWLKAAPRDQSEALVAQLKACRTAIDAWEKKSNMHSEEAIARLHWSALRYCLDSAAPSPAAFARSPSDSAPAALLSPAEFGDWLMQHLSEGDELRASGVIGVWCDARGMPDLGLCSDYAAPEPNPVLTTLLARRLGSTLAPQLEAPRCQYWGKVRLGTFEIQKIRLTNIGHGFLAGAAELHQLDSNAMFCLEPLYSVADRTRLLRNLTSTAKCCGVDTLPWQLWPEEKLQPFSGDEVVLRIVLDPGDSSSRTHFRAELRLHWNEDGELRHHPMPSETNRGYVVVPLDFYADVNFLSIWKWTLGAFVGGAALLALVLGLASIAGMEVEAQKWQHRPPGWSADWNPLGPFQEGGVGTPHSFYLQCLAGGIPIISIFLAIRWALRGKKEPKAESKAAGE